MEEMNQIAQSNGHWFSYLMGAVIMYHLYKQFKDKGIIDRLEAKLEELKNKLDK